MSNNPKPGYKLSEIGEIPEDWEKMRMAEKKRTAMIERVSKYLKELR